jgi:hypothetical protein
MGCTAHAHKIAPGRKGGEASLGEGNCWYPLTQQVNLHKMNVASQDFFLLLAVKAMSFPRCLVGGAEDFNHGDHFPSRRMDDLHEGLTVFDRWDGDSEGGVRLRRGNCHLYTYWGCGRGRPPHPDDIRVEEVRNLDDIEALPDTGMVAGAYLGLEGIPDIGDEALMYIRPEGRLLKIGVHSRKRAWHSTSLEVMSDK